MKTSIECVHRPGRSAEYVITTGEIVSRFKACPRNGFKLAADEIAALHQKIVAIPVDKVSLPDNIEGSPESDENTNAVEERDVI
jgi:hypothetical protein